MKRANVGQSIVTSLKETEKLIDELEKINKNNNELQAANNDLVIEIAKKMGIKLKEEPKS